MNKRFCINESYSEFPALGCMGCYMIYKWVFLYSDGTIETLTKRGRKK